jgi:hypothetical protein
MPALYRAQDKYPSSARELSEDRESKWDSGGRSTGGDEFGHDRTFAAKDLERPKFHAHFWQQS